MQFLLYNPFETNVSFKEAKSIYRRDPQPEKPLIAQQEAEKLRDTNDASWNTPEATQTFIQENAEQARWEILRQFTGQFDFSRYTNVKSDGTIEHSFFQKDAGFEDYLERYGDEAIAAGVGAGAGVARRYGGTVGRGIGTLTQAKAPRIATLAQSAGTKITALAKNIPGHAGIGRIAIRVFGSKWLGPIGFGVDAALLTYALLDDDPNATDNTALQNFTLAINAIEARAMQKLDDGETNTNEKRLDIARHTARDLSEIVGYEVEINEGSSSDSWGQRTPETDQFGLEVEKEEGFVQKKEADMANIDQVLVTTGYDAEAQEQIKDLMAKVNNLELDWRGWTLMPRRESEDDVSYQKTAIKSKIMEIYANPDIAAYIQQSGSDINTRFFGAVIQTWGDKMKRREGWTHLDFGTSDKEVDNLVYDLDVRKNQITRSIEKKVAPVRVQVELIQGSIRDFNATAKRDLSINEEITAQEAVLQGTLTYKKICDAIGGAISIENSGEPDEKMIFNLKDTNAAASKTLTEALKETKDDMETIGATDVTKEYADLAAAIAEADFNDTGDKNPNTLAKKIAEFKQTIEAKTAELISARAIADTNIQTFQDINRNLSEVDLEEASWPAGIPEESSEANFDQIAQINGGTLLNAAREALAKAKGNLKERAGRLTSENEEVKRQVTELKQTIDALNVSPNDLDKAKEASEKIKPIVKTLKRLEALEGNDIGGATDIGGGSSAEIAGVKSSLEALKQDHQRLEGRIDHIIAMLNAPNPEIEEIQKQLEELRTQIHAEGGAGSGTGNGGERPSGERESNENKDLTDALREYETADDETARETTRKILRPFANLPVENLEKDKPYTIDFKGNKQAEKALKGGHLFGPEYPEILVTHKTQRTPITAIYNSDKNQYFEQGSTSTADNDRVKIQQDDIIKILKKKGETATQPPEANHHTSPSDLKESTPAVAEERREGAIDLATSAISDDILGQGIGGTLEELSKGNLLGATESVLKAGFGATKKVINIPSKVFSNQKRLKKNEQETTIIPSEPPHANH